MRHYSGLLFGAPQISRSTSRHWKSGSRDAYLAVVFRDANLSWKPGRVDDGALSHIAVSTGRSTGSLIPARRVGHATKVEARQVALRIAASVNDQRDNPTRCIRPARDRGNHQNCKPRPEDFTERRQCGVCFRYEGTRGVHNCAAWIANSKPNLLFLHKTP